MSLVALGNNLEIGVGYHFLRTVAVMIMRASDATGVEFVICKHLLPEVKQLSYNLRSPAHGLTLPSKDERNFIPWLLHKDIVY